MATEEGFSEDDRKNIEYVPIRVTANIILHIGAGIYHSVAGALKELVNNSFDASATQVSITTDYPNFEQIKVVDNGLGMSDTRFKQAMSTIGSSLKGIIDTKRTTKYFGRPVIGKLGIGLMSLSQVCSKAIVESQEEGSDKKFVAILDFSLFKKRADIESRRLVLEDQYGGVEEMRILLNNPKTNPAVKKDINSLLEIIGQMPGERSDKEELDKEHLGHCIMRKNLPAIEGQKGTTITLTDIDKTVIESLKDSGKSEKLLSKFKQKQISWEEHCNEVNSWSWEELCERLRLETNGLSYQLLPKYHQFIWELSLMTPITYLPEGPITIRPRVLQEKKKELKDFNFQLRVDDRLLHKPVLQPSGLLARGDEELRETYDYNIETFTFNREIAGERLRYRGYIYWQRNQVQPAPLRGIEIYIRNVGIGTYDYTLVQFPTVNLASRAGQISGEVYVEEGLERALNIDRNGFRQTDEHYVALQQHIWGLLGSASRGDGIFGKSINAYDLRKEQADKQAQKKHIQILKDEVERISEGKCSLVFSNVEKHIPYAFENDGIVIYDKSPRWPRSKQERFISQRLLIPVIVAVESGSSARKIVDLMESLILK